MKSAILLMLAGLTLYSCKKSNNDGPRMGFPEIEGKWRMVLVIENNSGQTFVKPSSISGNVEITIRHTTGRDGLFSGNTPSNFIIDNPLSLGDNGTISIPSLGMSDALETEWGSYFVDHICFSKEYNLSGNRLEIKTTDLTLFFHRI